jgi:hypothetical protein
MKPSLPAASALLALSLAAGAAPAQEIQLTGPIGGRPWMWNRPQRIEWSQWLAGGGGAHLPAGREGRDGVFGVGVEATVRLKMFPAKDFFRDADFELRGGGWVSAITDGRGMRGEGGVVALYGCAGPDRLLVPALRLGAGWGSDGLGRVPHLVATFTLGLRAAAEKWPGQRRRLAFVSGLRLFVTTRGGLAREATYQITSGIELDPAFFSPLTWGGKVLGAGR